MAISEQIFSKSLKIIFGIIGIIILLYISYLIVDILIMIAFAVLVSLIFNPLVKLIESQGLHRLTSVIIVFLLSGLVIFIGLYVFIPKIIGQLNALGELLSKENVNQVFVDFQEIIQSSIPIIDSSNLASKLSEFFSNLIFSSVDNISNIVSSIFSVLALSVIVPFMTFFMLKDSNKIIKGIVNIMPNRYFEMTYLVIYKIRVQLGRFVRGWLFDAFVVGALSAIGLSILGIKNAISIGVIAGVGHLIPYFGPIVGGLPAIIISLIQFGDLSMLPGIVIMFTLVYTIDNGLIQPNVFSKSTDIHPLMIIILILVGSKILGVLGMLLAVPTATIVKTATREIYLGIKKYKIIKTHV
ncbi:MAG: AI-2E family transporter [Melioribacteraceae bacterium]|nr:AI-2E family transporter [Melioribacteraceae bacterium]MCO6472575.1 AI-2E family transporter [Melioribacteraceae bacterium]MDD3559482.1 AI-2E family transporter [Melioribacteraceae bacterium]